MIIWPAKVNLSFATTPPGLTLYLDGIAKMTPFVYDTLPNFVHTIEARDQSSGSTAYQFASWSDGGAQLHTITVPSTAQTYTASFTSQVIVIPPAFVQVDTAVPQTNQTAVTVTYPSAQTAGNLNIVAIGWNAASGTVTSVVDSAGNVYQQAAAVVRGAGLSQTIWYARNIVASARPTPSPSRSLVRTPFVDLRAAEYSGVDPVNPIDVTASASGSSNAGEQRCRGDHVRQRRALRRGHDGGRVHGRHRWRDDACHHDARRRHHAGPDRVGHRLLQRDRPA